jgi:hypothetical protein
MDKKRLNEIVDYVYNLYEEIQQLHEVVRLGNQEIISRSDAQRLMHFSAKKRYIFTIEFIKRTNGERRVMNGMTGVRQYVNGRGLPYDNIAKGLFTVFDVKAPGSGAKKYRQVPLDSISRLKINQRVYKVVDDNQYNTLSGAFRTKVNKDTDQFPVKGMDSTGAQNKADQDARASAQSTDPGTSNSILTRTTRGKEEENPTSGINTSTPTDPGQSRDTSTTDDERDDERSDR